MSKQTDYQNIKQIVHISTNFETDCKECNVVTFHCDSFGDAVNHYLKKHDYKLLHVGQETDIIDDKIIHNSIAILGI